MVGDSGIELRTTEPGDLESFFVFQLDAEANHLAAFTAKDPADKAAYLAKYARLLAEPSVNMKTIVVGGRVAGSISVFEIEGEAEVTYWIDKAFWGEGIATAALTEFLKTELRRPIRGRVAFDNLGSQKVLERCGFARIGTDRGFANARQAEIEEFIYKLT